MKLATKACNPSASASWVLRQQCASPHLASPALGASCHEDASKVGAAASHFNLDNSKERSSIVPDCWVLGEWQVLSHLY